MSGLSRTPGKRVGVNSPPRVRIPLPPPAPPAHARPCHSRLAIQRRFGIETSDGRIGAGTSHTCRSTDSSTTSSPRSSSIDESCQTLGSAGGVTSGGGANAPGPSADRGGTSACSCSFKTVSPRWGHSPCGSPHVVECNETVTRHRGSVNPGWPALARRDKASQRPTLVGSNSGSGFRDGPKRSSLLGQSRVG
jgi:hypothetical protein